MQDAEKGRHSDIQELLLKHGGKAFRKLAISESAQEEIREGDRRHAITEILFFASVGDIKRMHGLCLVHDISVGVLNLLDAAMHVLILSYQSFSTDLLEGAILDTVPRAWRRTKAVFRQHMLMALGSLAGVGSFLLRL